MTGVAVTPPPSAPPSRKAWLRPDFRRLWFATSVSQLGTHISELALPLTAIIILRASAFAVGALSSLGYLPFLLLGLPAGAWVEQARKRTVLVAADLVRALALASIPVAYAVGALTLAQLYVVAFTVGSFTVFFDIAQQTFLPEVLQRSELVDGNAKLLLSEQASSVLGPGVGGALIALVRAPFAIAADAVSYVGSAALIMRIRSHEQANERPEGAARASMRVRIGEGLRYVVRHPYLRALFATSMIVNFFGRMLQVVVLVFMVRQAHLSAAWIGIAFSLGTIGFVVGAALAERVIERLGLGRAIVDGSLLTIPSFLLVAVTPRHLAVPFVAGWLLLYGFGAMMFNIGHVTFRQATTPREILGRVNATLRFVSWGAVPIGTLLGGLLGSAFGLRAAMWVAAGGGLFGPLPLLLSGVRSLRTLPESADRAG